MASHTSEAIGRPQGDRYESLCTDMKQSCTPCKVSMSPNRISPYKIGWGRRSAKEPLEKCKAKRIRSVT